MWGDCSPYGPILEGQPSGLTQAQADLTQALSALAGIPIRLPPDGFPPFSARMRDPKTTFPAGDAPGNNIYVRLVTLAVPEGLIGQVGAYGIGISDWDERANTSFRLDLPSRLADTSWNEVGHRMTFGFPTCYHPTKFELFGGEEVGISAQYTGVLPATLRVHAFLGGWIWAPMAGTRDQTYRGRIEG